MAFFKFRKSGDEPSAPPQAAQSLETMRRRARHRLIGSVVLVLAAVVGFPLLFDSQPRPIAVDIPIEIPDKTKIQPLPPPAVTPPTQASGVIIEEKEAPALPAPSSAAQQAKPVSADVRTETKTTPKNVPENIPGVPSVAKTTTKQAASQVPAQEELTKAAKLADAAKAQSLLNGKHSPAVPKVATAEKSPADGKTPVPSVGRFVVQVGAYSDGPKAHEARMKVERAGHKTYTQVVGPKDQQRIRVRVGPFTTKAEAQKVADKLKKLSLPAAILEL